MFILYIIYLWPKWGVLHLFLKKYLIFLKMEIEENGDLEWEMVNKTRLCISNSSERLTWLIHQKHWEYTHFYRLKKFKHPWCPIGFLKSSIDLKLREILIKRTILFSYMSSQHKELWSDWVIDNQFNKCNYKMLFQKEQFLTSKLSLEWLHWADSQSMYGKNYNIVRY